VRAQHRRGLAQAVAQSRPAPVEALDRVGDRGRVEVESARQPWEQRRERRPEMHVGHQSTTATSTDATPGR
jgi:hypothetical protein